MQALQRLGTYFQFQEGKYYYDELAAAAMKAATLLQVFPDDEPPTLVIFDGLSIRELPFIEKFARQTSFKIIKHGYGHAAFPHDVKKFQTIPEKRLAMLRGRIKNRPQGHAAANAYRHGGFSLMEMLTPWLMIEKLEN